MVFVCDHCHFEIPDTRTGAALAYMRGFSADSITAPLLSGIMRQFSEFIESNKKTAQHKGRMAAKKGKV